jgi:hypothetical protein
MEIGQFLFFFGEQNYTAEEILAIEQRRQTCVAPTSIQKSPSTSILPVDGQILIILVRCTF